MQKVTKNAAYVKHRTDESGVTVAVYGGAMCGETLVDLRSAVAMQAQNTRAYVVRLERSCLMMGVDPFIPVSGDFSALPGGAVVCRQDQLETMRVYARYMAEHGVIRVVFLESEIQAALNFARRHAEYRQ